MAFSHGKDGKIFVNGYNLSAYLTSFKSTEDVDMAETSTFGTSAKTYVAGMRDATLSLEGYFDGVAGAVDDVLKAAIQVNDSIFMLWPQGDTVGLYGYGFKANESSYEVSGDTGGVVSISVEAQSNVGAERLIAYHAMATESATGNGTSVDGSASSTGGAVAYLEVPDITGITALGVKFQDSADNVSWLDITGGAFTSVTANFAKQRLAISGTIRRYVRTVWTFTGTGTATFAVGLGRL